MVTVPAITSLGEQSVRVLQLLFTLNINMIEDSKLETARNVRMQPMKSLHNSASTVCLRSSTGRRGVVRRAQTNPVEMPHKSLFVRTHHWVEILGPESQNLIVTMVTSRLT